MVDEGEAMAVYRQLVPSARQKSADSEAPARLAPRQTHAPTGVQRLDELLGGGLPAGSATLLYGPPFAGKGVLQRSFFLSGARRQSPSLFLLTDLAAPDFVERLLTMDPNAHTYEQLGSAQYVDGYSSLIGERVQAPHTHFVDDLRSLDRVVRVVDQVDAQLRLRGLHLERLVIQSLSTIMMEAGSADTFRFLRSIVGRVARRGGTVLAGLEAGMHNEPDVQAVKHLCTGMIQTRENDDRFYLRVEGLPTLHHPGWVEYEFTPERFELTGSFSSERIRGSAAGA